jgi:hypothetical protein
VWRFIEPANGCCFDSAFLCTPLFPELGLAERKPFRPRRGVQRVAIAKQRLRPTETQGIAVQSQFRSGHRNSLAPNSKSEAHSSAFLCTDKHHVPLRNKSALSRRFVAV